MPPTPTSHVRRGRARLRLLSLTSLLAVVAMVAVPPLGAAASTPYGSNLVKNSGAENGVASWETFANATTKAYGSAGLGFPSKTTSNNIGGAKKFFYAGLYDNGLGTCGDFQQTIVLNGLGSAIDNGHVKVRLRGYAGTNGAGDINAHLDLYFRNASNHSVASNGIEKTASSTNEHYTLFQSTKTLSKHTRILRVHLWADGSSTENSDCQAFWDKISVVLIAS